MSEDIGVSTGGPGQDPNAPNPSSPNHNANGGLKNTLMRWSMQLGLAPAHVSTVPSVVVEQPSDAAEEGPP